MIHRAFKSLTEQVYIHVCAVAEVLDINKDMFCSIKMNKQMKRIFNESGKGYWMEGVGCLRSEGENRPSRPGHIIVEHMPVVIGCDLYNGQVTGNIACNLNASSCNSSNHAGPSVLLCLNDQGGSIMNISNDFTSTLRAQDHGHPPIVYYEK